MEQGNQALNLLQFDDRRTNEIFILGNGPSLKGFDFSALREFDTLGMNAAYRFWERINWFPTYYCCMDTVVIVSHKEAIYRLIKEQDKNGIKFFFLSEAILQHYPELSSHPAVFILNELKSQSSLFDVNLVTTGSYSILFSALMGYRNIYLLGIDLNYVEIIDGAKRLEGFQLEIEAPIKENPNYFFDDYQVKGDKYHIPNAHPDLHLRAWNEVKDHLAHLPVKIVNCNPNSKLTIFDFSTVEAVIADVSKRHTAEISPRESLNYRQEFRELWQAKVSRIAAYPRVLIICGVRLNRQTGGGVAMTTLFQNWPKDKLAQIHADIDTPYDSSVCEHYFYLSTHAPVSSGTSLSQTALDFADFSPLVTWCRTFSPEVIYYQPLQHPHYFTRLVLELSQILDVPIVTHIMDDWPARVTNSFIAQGRQKDTEDLQTELKSLFRASAVSLSITEEMSSAFKERYGVDYTVFQHSIHIDEWEQVQKDYSRTNDVFKVVYIGKLLPGMQAESLLEIAQAVDELRGRDVPIQMEFYGPPFLTGKYGKEIEETTSAVYKGFIARDDFPRTLMDADLLVICYNFDPSSFEFHRYSIPAKLPEYMASGTAILVYSPEETPIVNYARAHGIAEVVVDKARLSETIEFLLNSPERRKTLGTTARNRAFEWHSHTQVSEAFRSTLTHAASIRRQLFNKPLVGAYSREQKAQFDEIKLAQALLPGTGVMIDVGGHIGTALMPLAKTGWRVVAFEPDPANRLLLQDAVRNMPNVTVDPRALSDQPSQHVPFFASDESTGISSLRGFTAQHREVAQVEVTTLTEALIAHDIDTIDFLKIDTEGYDLMVLKGLPWEQLRPSIIICEFENTKTEPLGYDFHAVARFLRFQGYTVLVSEWHPIVRYGIAHEWRQLTLYPCQLGSATAWGNLLAFREPPDINQITQLAEQYLTFRVLPKPPVNTPVSEPELIGEAPIMFTASSENQDLKSRINRLIERLMSFYIGRLRWYAIAFVIVNVMAALDTPLSPLFALVNAVMLLVLLGHVVTRPPR